MKLFGKHKEQAPEALPAELPGTVAPADGEAQDLRLRIEDEPKPQPEQAPEALKAPTNALPDPKEVEDLVRLTVASASGSAEARKPEPAEKPEAGEGDKPAPAETAPDAVKEAPEAEAAGQEAPEEAPLKLVTFASEVAQAVESAAKEPTGRYARDAVDDETLLAELHALIGDASKPQPEPAPFTKPAQRRSPPAARPVARITAQTLKDVPEEYEDLSESDAAGVPGWLKGLFILLIALLLSAMTFYAVASDVIGEVF